MVRDRGRSGRPPRPGAGERTGRYDCLHLLSGGKDSTYALLRLVAMGFEVFAFTLDNGFISDQAKENIRRSVAFLGIEHEFATTDAMNEIFRDSLERYSNVCNGCFKTIYILGTARAAELGVPLVVTGLSRGQLFETRLVPAQFAEDRFDPEAIDRAVVAARRHYHRVDDGPNRLLDTSVFADGRRVRAGRLRRLLPLRRCRDGRDVRLPRHAGALGPPDRHRSIDELPDQRRRHPHPPRRAGVPQLRRALCLGRPARPQAPPGGHGRARRPAGSGAVETMLAAVGYRPAPRQILTAWFELGRGQDVAPRPVELRAFLGHVLPGHAMPAAFVAVDELPMTANGKLDAAALPPPERVHRSGPALYVSPDSPLESMLVSIWEQVLELEPIGVDDDFFALGGDSLAALEMIVMLSERLGRACREDLPVRAHDAAPSRRRDRARQLWLRAFDLGDTTTATDARPPSRHRCRSVSSRSCSTIS